MQRLAGKTLLKLLKNRMSLAPLCRTLDVRYREDRPRVPSPECYEEAIEALIHQIISMDRDIKLLLDRLWLEMKRVRYPITTKDEWVVFQSMNKDEDY
jgi:hypothetical protein